MQKIKTFNEFLEEGFMSRMVDTVYNKEPKRENDTIENAIVTELTEWINSYDFSKFKLKSGQNVLNNHLFGGFSKEIAEDLISRLCGIKKNNLIYKSENAEGPREYTSEHRFYSGDTKPNYYGDIPYFVVIWINDKKDETLISIDKDIFNSLPDEVKNKFSEKVTEGFMSRMVDTVYNDEPKKENEGFFDLGDGRFFNFPKNNRYAKTIIRSEKPIKMTVNIPIKSYMGYRIDHLDIYEFNIEYNDFHRYNSLLCVYDDWDDGKYANTDPIIIGVSDESIIDDEYSGKHYKESLIAMIKSDVINPWFYDSKYYASTITYMYDDDDFSNRIKYDSHVYYLFDNEDDAKEYISSGLEEKLKNIFENKDISYKAFDKYIESKSYGTDWIDFDAMEEYLRKEIAGDFGQLAIEDEKKAIQKLIDLGIISEDDERLHDLDENGKVKFEVCDYEDDVAAKEEFNSNDEILSKIKEMVGMWSMKIMVDYDLIDIEALAHEVYEKDGFKGVFEDFIGSFKVNDEDTYSIYKEE